LANSMESSVGCFLSLIVLFPAPRLPLLLAVAVAVTVAVGDSGSRG
jgi:hypothetical protein